MQKCILIAYIFICTTSLNRCAGDSHTYTNEDNETSSNEDNEMFERTLFTRNTTIPKSYVVTFKYIASTIDGLIHQAVIHSNAQNTTGHLDLTQVENRFAVDEHVNAEINIPNATNFNVGVELRGSALFVKSDFGRFVPLRFTQRKIYALICSTPEKKNTEYREWMFGERKDGDTILYARKKSGKFLGKFQYIEYEDSNVIFTAAVIKLNSTNAAVFPQKVRLTKHRFYATIYDLNRGNIAHIALIYGYRT